MRNQHKHTPGPWRYSTSQDGWSYTIHISQADDAPFTPGWSDVGYIIQTCQGEEQATQEANARLIAAAPELLAACQSLVNWCDKNKPAGEALFFVTQAREAIAKATGQ